MGNRRDHGPSIRAPGGHPPRVYGAPGREGCILDTPGEVLLTCAEPPAGAAHGRQATYSLTFQGVKP
jgi:hypothetical protein